MRLGLHPQCRQQRGSIAKLLLLVLLAWLRPTLSQSFLAAAQLLQKGEDMDRNATWPKEGCQPMVPPDWQPKCAMERGRMYVNNNVLDWVPFTSPRWGNVLSPYWQARSMALHGGLAFNSFNGLRTYWFKYLPAKIPATSCPNIEKWNNACRQCKDIWWEFSHACVGGWTEMYETIRSETRQALDMFLKEDMPTVQAPVYNPGDVLIQSRCASDTLLQSEDYGPTAFSYAPKDSKMFYVMHSKEETLKQTKCMDIHVALKAFLEEKFPGANVTFVSGDILLDFLRMVHAPILFKDSTSTYALWAALANVGQVWSVPLRLKTAGSDPRPNFGPNWHWSEAVTLYKDEANKVNLTIDMWSEVINFLKSN